MNQNLLHKKTLTVSDNIGTMNFSGSFNAVHMYQALHNIDLNGYKIDPIEHRKNMIVANRSNSISFYVVKK